MMAIKFGSRKARKILIVDKGRPDWMADVEGYGSPAPLPQYDSEGNWIERVTDGEDDEDAMFDEHGEPWMPSGA